jgi:SepF-like predicted cell division protein (DUF552 family)
MGFLDKLKGAEETEYMELDTEAEEPAGKKLLIEIDRLDNYNDSDRIQRKVRDGSVIIIKVRDLKAKDTNELKRAIEKIKKTCMAIDGDIAGIGDDWIVVCPKSVKVHRELAEE